MKQFTEIPIQNLDQVKTGSLTKNTDKYIGEFNGELDSNNLPIDSIITSSMKKPQVIVADTAGSNIKQSAHMPSQRYYITKINNQTQSKDIYTPSLTVNLDTDDWSKGFNHLPSLSSIWEGYHLDFEAQEGSLIGCATIDWEHGTQVYNVQITESPNSSQPMSRGNGWWTEWGVFVNNVMVSRSGPIYPRRHTTQLPFHVPCGSQSISIDVRVRLNTFYVTGNAAVFHSTPFNLWSTTIWCRNEYR